MLGKCAVLQVLLQAGAHFDAALQYKSLSCAIWQLDDAAAAEVVKVLLPYCSSLDELNASDGHTALSYALSCGKLQAARALHAGGADMHCTVQRRTMAHIAAQSGSVAVLKWVQSVGVDLRTLNAGALLPLHCACSANKLEAVKYLLDVPGAADDVHARTAQQQTPLFYAVSNSADSVVQLLLQRSAAVDARCSAGMTPLMRARAASTVKLLLAAGADIAAVGATELTVLHYLARCGAAAGAVCLILKAGVDPTALDMTGSTAAHVAGMNGHFALEALLSRAADDHRKKQARASSTSGSSGGDGSSEAIGSSSNSSCSSSANSQLGSSGSSSTVAPDTGAGSAKGQQTAALHGAGVTTQPQSKPLKTKQPCANCSRLTAKRCRRCKAVYYCSAECQKVCFKEAGHRAQCEATASAMVLHSSSVKQAAVMTAVVAPAKQFKAALVVATSSRNSDR
jgi:ankyrin repeat protein